MYQFKNSGANRVYKETESDNENLLNQINEYKDIITATRIHHRMRPVK